jgi:hypothetical protein
MLGRAFIVWMGLLVIAVAFGAVREAVVAPRLGSQTAHVLGTIAFCLAILAVAWASIGWIGPRDGGAAVWIGLGWVGLTVAFEFLAGHYLFGHPWARLLADYNILRGRIWLLVLVTTGVAPVVAARLRGLAGF